MTEKFKSARVARRKTIRTGYQCIATARRINCRHNDGHSNKVAVKIVARLRHYKISQFSGLVAR